MKGWSIIEALNWAVLYLEEKGVNSSPRLDAELLLAHALNLERIDLYLSLDRVLNHKEWAIFNRLIKRRKNHEPIAYILGEKEFMSLTFRTNPDVLIPRPETELLVEEIVRIAGGQKPTDTKIIVDIGTGCGNITGSLAKLLPYIQVYAIDISQDALNVAKENFRILGLDKRIIPLCGDLLEPLRGLGLEEGVDFIVSNPPYIAKEEWEDLPIEVRNFEPRIALDGGEDGLELHRRIIKEAYGYLKNGGFLALEMGVGQSQRIMELFKSQGYLEPKTTKDYRGIERVIIGQKGF